MSSLNGVVVSAGKMMRCVKVRVARQEWNSHIRKYYPSSQNLLVSDPRDSTREGDVVSIAPGWRTSKHVHHVVTSILAPFGTPVSERPAIPTEEERIAERDAKKAAKQTRRAEKRGREAGKSVSRREARAQKDARVGSGFAATDEGQKSSQILEKGLKNEAELEAVQKKTEGLGRIAEEVARTAT